MRSKSLSEASIVASSPSRLVVVTKPLARSPFSRKEARRGSSSAIRIRFM